MWWETPASFWPWATHSPALVLQRRPALPRPSEDCRPTIAASSSLCQTPEMEETTSGRDIKKRRIMLEIEKGWTRSLLSVTFYDLLCSLDPLGRRLKHCLLLNHWLTELEVSQLAFRIFILLFLSPFSSSYISHTWLLSQLLSLWQPPHCERHRDTVTDGLICWF